jgi:peptide-methionine (R)-S-oxide reductase
VTYEVEKSEEEWREQLPPESYAVLREAATERPFTGKYEFSDDKGMYVCLACGNELFSSEAKFDSGCGWPSFTDPAGTGNIELREDRSHGMIRTEVLCKRCGGHLGHLFDDGPGPSGARYCINSVALDLKTEGAEAAS